MRNSGRTMVVAFVLATMTLGCGECAGAAPVRVVQAPQPSSTITPAPEITPSPSPARVLGLIRLTFRSHRPPPPFVTYTLERRQYNHRGQLDFTGSETWHMWTRTADRATLARRVYLSTARGPLEFMRPAFNAAVNPGPPTADVFEPAPAQTPSIDVVPTPEAANAPPVIGGVIALVENDYHVDSLRTEGDFVRLRVTPLRAPERNRLREIWADKTSYELRKLVASDRLYTNNRVYGVTFTIDLGVLGQRPVITDIRGVVGDGYVGNGATVTYHFTNVAFPPSLPAWYFDRRTYAAHPAEAPR